LDPLISRIYVSRHVVFNESHYPFSSSTSSCHQPSHSTTSSWLSNLLFFHPCQIPSVLGPAPQSSPSPSPRPTSSTASPLQNTLPSILGPIPLSLNSPIIPVPNLESFPITQPDSSTPHPNPYNTLSFSTSSVLPNPTAPVHHTANSSPCFSLLPNPTAPVHHTASPPPTSSILPNPTATINPLPTLSSHPMQTRSKSGIIKKKCFASSTTINYLQTEPPNYTIASKIPKWRAAIASEFDALHWQHTWSLVPPCPDQNVIGCRRVYKIKRNTDGSISRYKARLVAKGFHQQAGVDFDETFSPVVKPPTVRIILSLAAQNQWSLRQLDVSNAFLHGLLKESVFMAQPISFLDSAQPSHICQLHKSLYELKQAPRAWFERFTSHLLTMGFSASVADASLFVFHHGSTTVYLLLYVDDIIITGNNPTVISDIITQLSIAFELKDLGPLRYLLGLQIEYKKVGLFVHQHKYITDLLTKFHMT
jgi:hypothetical protein